MSIVIILESYENCRLLDLSYVCKYTKLFYKYVLILYVLLDKNDLIVT